MVGVTNDNVDENGVFNPRTLGIVKEFSQHIALLPGIKAIRDEDVASVANGSAADRHTQATRSCSPRQETSAK